MENGLNRKILGAFVVGVALVAGAYTLANFTKPVQITQKASIGTSVTEAAPRTAISVTDQDENGIEDWRDSFVTTAPIIVDTEVREAYVPPATLTGQTGVNFIQDIISSKLYAGIGRTEDEVIDDTVNLLEQETSYKLYDLPDISILRNYSEQNIKDYANAIAGTIKQNNLEGYEHELYILNKILNYNEIERIAELEVMAKAYTSMRDGFLAVPVPQEFVKQHLDLINTFHAVGKDIEAMTLTIEDPIFTLLRLRRYEDDVLGMKYALENMYRSISSYPKLFDQNDAALLFSNFAPERRI